MHNHLCMHTGCDYMIMCEKQTTCSEQQLCAQKRLAQERVYRRIAKLDGAG